MLDNSNIRAFKHLPCRISEAILRNNRIRIDDQNNLAHPKTLPIRTPRTELALRLLVELFLRHLHRTVFK